MSQPSVRTFGARWRLVETLLLCLLSVLTASAQHRHFIARLGGSQQRPGAYGGVESEQRWGVAVNFSTERSNTVSGVYGNFYMTGVGGNISYNVWHGFGPVVDAYFMRAPNIAPHIDLSEYTYLGGLRYTLGSGSESSAPRRLQIFAEGLGGRVSAFNSLFPSANSTGGVTKNANSLEIEGGGGIDWRVGRKIGFRVVQADFVQTYLPNGQLNVQRNVRVSSGFSAHF